MEEWTAPNTDHAPPKAGEPALHRAARTGDHEAIRTLAAQGHKLNEAFDMGLDPGAYPSPATPLMVAAGSGDGATVETVRLLLELGADPKIVLDEDSAVIYACSGLGWNYREGGDAARLALLLEAGSPLPSRASKRSRILSDTARAGDIERLNVLLAHGLKADGDWDPDEAARRGKQMEESMAEMSASFPDPFEGMPWLMRKGLKKAMKQVMKQTMGNFAAPMSFEIPLFMAVEADSLPCVEALLAAGADPHKVDNGGKNAMHHAQSSAMIERLKAAGLTLEEADQFDWTVLVNAVSEGEGGLPRIRALIESGADVNATHDRGYTLFMSACSDMERSRKVLEVLVEAGANPHAITELGYNAFHAAIDVNGEANEEACVREILGYLREIGVDINHRNNAQQTPLTRAIEEGTGIEVVTLCELGADPSLAAPARSCGPRGCDVQTELPLFLAAKNTLVARDQKVGALLKAGANPLATDANGSTPLAHLVSELVNGNRGKYEKFYKQFYGDFLRNGPRRDSREQFVSDLLPSVRDFVTRFAADIPIGKGYYAAETRPETLEAIALLCTYEAWAHGAKQV